MLDRGEDAGGAGQRGAEAEGEGDDDVVLMPISEAAMGLNDSARIAMPILRVQDDEAQADEQQQASRRRRSIARR